MLLTDGGDFGNLETEEIKASAIFATNTTLLAMERNCGICRTNYIFFAKGVTRMMEAGLIKIHSNEIFLLPLASPNNRQISLLRFSIYC